MDTSPKIGLVLGGGGVLGAAWLIGALNSLFEASNWHGSNADHVVGTSAGSVVGALIAGGISTEMLVAHQRGADLAEFMSDEQVLPTAREASRYNISRRLPRFVLGSPQLALRAALQPWRYPPTTALAGFLGRGMMSTSTIGQVASLVTVDGWSAHRKLWIVAVDYATGRRVVFGTPGAPEAQLPEAVQASCAIPGFYRPVRIASRRYIVGGTWSPSNLDLLAQEDLDLVICFNPTSSLNPGPGSTLLESAERRLRKTNGRRLGREARKLREAGKRVLLIQPGEQDLVAMGVNLMNPKRRELVLETALRSTARRLTEPDAAEVVEELKSTTRRSIPVDSEL